MRTLITTTAAAAVLAGLAGAALAQTRIYEPVLYTARLSAQDQENSNGEPLTTVAQIIRQDRANFHRFNRRDSEDTDDGELAEEAVRAAYERAVILAVQEMSQEDVDVIINGSPLIEVVPYRLEGDPFRYAEIRVIAP